MNRLRRLPRFAAIAFFLLCPSGAEVFAQATGADALPPLPEAPVEAAPATLPVARPQRGDAVAPVANTAADRTNRVREISDLREGMRRAFVQRDYEKVLTLGQGMQQKYGVVLTGNYWMAASQQMLNEKKVTEAGTRPYPKIQPKAPTLTGVIPSVEPSPAGQLVAFAPATPAPIASPEGAPAIVDATPADGAVLPTEAASIAPAATAGIDPATSATSAAGDRMIASASTPSPIAARAAAPAIEPLPASQIERYYIAIVVAAVLILIGVIVVMQRRGDPESEPDLATTLSGLATPKETPAPVLPARPVQRGAAPVERSAPRPAPANVPASKEPEDDEMFGTVATGTGKSKQPEGTLRFDPEDFEQTTERIQTSAAAAHEPSALDELDRLTDSIAAAADPIRLEDIPDAPACQQWKPSGDEIQIGSFNDLLSEIAEPPAAASSQQADAAFDLPMLDREPSPESAGTKAGDEPQARVPIDSNPFEKTKTSWDRDEVTQKEAPAPASTAPDREEMGGGREFRSGETIDLREPGIAKQGETVSSAPQAQPSDQTVQSPGAPRAEEDLFDREKRQGLEAMAKKDWGGAVHHLSVAAALRPEHMEIKEKLREARRQRKTHHGR